MSQPGMIPGTNVPIGAIVAAQQQRAMADAEAAVSQPIKVVSSRHRLLLLLR